MNDLLTSRTLQVGNTLTAVQITPLTAQVTAPSINFRKREATLAWVGNLIEGQTISEAADAI